MRTVNSGPVDSEQRIGDMSEETKHAEHEHHIVGPGVYVVIFFALLVGTALTVWASFLELGPWNPIIALAIATTKATAGGAVLHALKYSTKLTKLTVFAGIFTFLILVSMTLADYISRAWGSW